MQTAADLARLASEEKETAERIGATLEGLEGEAKSEAMDEIAGCLRRRDMCLRAIKRAAK